MLENRYFPRLLEEVQMQGSTPETERGVL